MELNLAIVRELPAFQRRAILTATVLIGLGLAIADYRTPNVEFRPLVFFLILVAAAIGGLRFGMTFAIVATPLFAFAEWAATGRPPDYRLALNALIAATTFLFTPLLVVFIQTRVKSSERLAAQLAAAEHDRLRLEEREVARSALAKAEASYRAIGESIPFGIWQTDAEGNLLYISESFRAVCGMTLDELENGGWLERVPEPDAKRFLERWADRDAGGDIWEGEYRLRGVDGRMYAVLSRGVRLKDAGGGTIGWVGVSLDITERKRSADALALLEEAGRQLTLSLDPPVILERIARLCVSRIADWCWIDMVRDDGTLGNSVIKHADPQFVELAQELSAYAIEPDAETGPAAVVRTRQPELLADAPEVLVHASAADVRQRRLLNVAGMKAAMVVPLISREKVLGALTLIAAESKRSYDESDLAVAQVLGVRTALAYENAMHYAREARVADTFQRASLPSSMPQLPGIRINATYLPGASDSEIGGDWYDAFLLPDGELDITIGDVAGKGLPAAVTMAMVRQALRGAALDGLAPDDALKRVNRHLCHERTGMVTAISATLDPATNFLRFASAGHPPMMIASLDGNLRTLRAPGVPLGLFADADYASSACPLYAGDLMVLYTDGLTEFDRDVARGEKLLEEAVLAEKLDEAANPAVSIQRRMMADRPKDDVAVLTVSLASSPMTRLDAQAPAAPTSARLLRQALRRLALGVGMRDERAFPLLVAAGEAISNAIEHAYGTSDGNVWVRGWAENGQLFVEIADSGGWRTPREEGRGRGLLVMRSIVDSIEISATDSGTTVRLAMAIKEGGTG